MDQLVPFFASVCRGGLWGMLMGGGLGTLTGIVAIHRTDPAKTLAFQHPLSGNVVELDTYDLDEQDVVRMLRRVQQTLNVEPSIRPEAHRQFVIILARVRNFYNSLKMYTDRPDVVRYKIQTRKLATAASQTIRNFESFIWDSPEIEGIVNDLETVQTAMIDKMLSLDSFQTS
jgi:hypothetical protein